MSSKNLYLSYAEHFHLSRCAKKQKSLLSRGRIIENSSSSVEFIYTFPLKGLRESDFKDHNYIMSTFYFKQSRKPFFRKAYKQKQNNLRQSSQNCHHNEARN